MRPVLALGVLVGVVASGCSNVERNAASVDDTTVTIEEYESLLAEFAANPEVTGLQEDLVTGTVPATDARRWLSLMVQGAANEEFLAGAGEQVTDEDRQAVRDEIAEGDPLLQFSDEVVSLVVDQQAGSAARARIAAPDAGELERRYDASPRSLGVVCVRHVVLDTEADAEDVADELRAGVDVAELAAARSTDPSAADNGGAVEGTGGACIPIPVAAQQLDPAFAAAAVTAHAGETVGPVQTPFGWHVIQARPYDEVAESLEALYQQAAGELLYAGFLATADIQVDPRYGRWDRATSTVVGL